MNLYQAFGGNPVNYTDPWGMDSDVPEWPKKYKDKVKTPYPYPKNPMGYLEVPAKDRYKALVRMYKYLRKEYSIWMKEDPRFLVSEVRPGGLIWGGPGLIWATGGNDEQTALSELFHEILVYEFALATPFTEGKERHNAALLMEAAMAPYFGLNCEDVAGNCLTDAHKKTPENEKRILALRGLKLHLKVLTELIRAEAKLRKSPSTTHRKTLNIATFKPWKRGYDKYVVNWSLTVYSSRGEIFIAVRREYYRTHEWTTKTYVYPKSRVMFHIPGWQKIPSGSQKFWRATTHFKIDPNMINKHGGNLRKIAREAIREQQKLIKKAKNGK